MDSFSISKHGHSRFWAVRDAAGELVCVCVYKRGAVEVARRLSPASPSSPDYLNDAPRSADVGLCGEPLDRLRHAP